MPEPWAVPRWHWTLVSPTVTHHVKHIEQWAGVQLLLRHGRGITLTLAGSRFLAQAEAAIQLLTSPVANAPAFKTDISKLTVAFPSAIGSLIMPSLLAEFHARQPEILMEVREGAGADVEEWFVNRQTDIAVLEDPPAISGANLELIFVQSLGVIGSPRQAFQRGAQNLALRDLSGQPFIFLDQRHSVTRRIALVSRQYGVHLRQVMVTNSVTMAKAMTSRGVGFTVLPYSAASEELSRGALLFYPIGALYCQPDMFWLHALSPITMRSRASFAANLQQ